MSKLCLVAAATLAAAACSSNPPPSTTMPTCLGKRVLIVNNGGDEPVNVYAINGRTKVEIGAAPIGKKELVIPDSVRATSYYAVAMSRVVLDGAAQTATTDTRIVFQEECRPK